MFSENNRITFRSQRGRAIPGVESLPQRRAIRDKALSLADDRLKQVKPLLQNAVDNSDVCFAMDFGKRVDDYFAVIAHFVVEVEGTWEMKSLPIGFIRPAEESKTARAIFSILQDIMQDLGINRYTFKLNAAISDEGANIVKAVKDNFAIRKSKSSKCC